MKENLSKNHYKIKGFVMASERRERSNLISHQQKKDCLVANAPRNDKKIYFTKDPTKQFFPKKSFGQNFLIDKRIIQKIIDSCNLTKDEIILEIGPGKGAITKGISQKAKEVLAVEKDDLLAENLKKNFEGTNVKVIHEDILKFDFQSLPKNIKVVGNLPYNIATPIIEKIIKSQERINSFYITVQLEYAKRLVAKPNSKDFSPLSCFIQYYARPEILFTIKNACFSPAPKIQSCFLKITFPSSTEARAEDEKKLFRLIHKAFQQRRKNLLNALSFIGEKKSLSDLLAHLKINPQARPENLSLEDYIKISNITAADTNEGY